MTYLHLKKKTEHYNIYNHTAHSISADIKIILAHDEENPLTLSEKKTTFAGAPLAKEKQNINRNNINIIILL